MTPLQNSTSQTTCGYIGCAHPQIPVREAKLCGRCKEVIYCGRECQKAAWPTHKIACKIIPISQTQEKPLKAFDIVKQGNTVSFQSKADVVSFCSCFSPQTIQDLKKNTRGLASLKPEFLKECNYVEVLKCLWTEDDLDRKISWLGKCVEKGHPILMLELSRALMEKAEKSSLSKEAAQECMKWYFLGIHCTRLDISCSTDFSTNAAISILKMNYSSVVQKAFDKLKNEIQTVQKCVLEDFNPSQLQSSPKWVALHGMDKFLGKDSMKEKSSWKETRLNKHQEILQQLK